ncbi:MAG: hypothetical protein NWR51_07300 [Akkermansiaceae bacterium]|nr:hypothetical protein [Akkermansiaceae bacterium]MDP4847051.1 hypothetical protein [Akkermansiaceae bacterium]
MNAETSDQAAVFAVAVSLRAACEKREAQDSRLNLSEAYSGMDEFWRELLRVGILFEEWACRHVAFDHLEEVWPYFLERLFGEACLAVMDATELASFDADDCLRLAFGLRLPVWEDGVLPIPVDVWVGNPVEGASFKAFRIQSVREHLSDAVVIPFTETSDPFDEELGERYFGIYGVEADGTLEHIADRRSYMFARDLVMKLAPGATCEERVMGLW